MEGGTGSDERRTANIPSTCISPLDATNFSLLMLDNFSGESSSRGANPDSPHDNVEIIVLPTLRQQTALGLDEAALFPLVSA